MTELNMPDDLRATFSNEMPGNWPEVLESRAAARYIEDTKGTADLLRATAIYIRQSLRQSHSTVAVAWEGYWPGAGSIDSQTRLTRFKKTADEWRAEGAEVTPLYTHPKEAEVTVTEEMAKRLFEWACDDLLPAYGIEASRFDSELAEACRVGLVAALSRKG